MGTGHPFYRPRQLTTTLALDRRHLPAVGVAGNIAAAHRLAALGAGDALQIAIGREQGKRVSHGKILIALAEIYSTISL